jgi:hypothetical protein
VSCQYTAHKLCCCGDGRKHTGSVSAIELLDSLLGIVVRLVGDECGALGAARAVILHLKLDDRSNLLEKPL